MKQQENTAADSGVAEAVAMLDPDVRFLLANERTLLAWVRTGLALIAGGLIFAQVATNSALQSGLGVAAILLGGMMSLLGYVRYRAADRAIRASRLPNTGRGITVQVIAVIGFALAIAVIELTRIW